MAAITTDKRTRWAVARLFPGSPGGPLLRPFEEIATTIDDAAAVAPKFWAGSFAPMIVERAFGHPHHFGCFGRNEEVVLSFVRHEAPPS